MLKVMLHLTNPHSEAPRMLKELLILYIVILLCVSLFLRLVVLFMLYGKPALWFTAQVMILMHIDNDARLH